MARRSPIDGPLATLKAPWPSRLRTVAAAYVRVKAQDDEALAKRLKVKRATLEAWRQGQLPIAWAEALAAAEAEFAAEQADERARVDAERERRLRGMDDLADSVLAYAMQRRRSVKAGKVTYEVPDREAIQAAQVHKTDRRKGEEIDQRREAQRVELSGPGGGPAVIQIQPVDYREAIKALAPEGGEEA